MRLLVVALLLVAPACERLFPSEECISDPMDAVIDPATGECIVVSNRDGCEYCFDNCVVADIADLDYAKCNTACTSASEAACLAMPGCRASYTPAGFSQCLATARSGALHGGRCAGLDAYECSRHDNCAAWYDDTGMGSGMGSGTGSDMGSGAGSATFNHCRGERPPPP